MKLNEITFGDQLPVDGYAPGGFRVGGEMRQGPLLLSAAGVQPWDGMQDHKVLIALAPVVDILFLGTGADIAHPPADLRAALEDAGIALEIMASPSACRTYNILLSEGRRVALAALPV